MAAKRPDLRIVAQVPDDPQPLGIGFAKNQAALLAALNGALVRARSSSVASDLFRRLNSYSKQHGLYQAIKAFGQILKSHFILRVIDEPALRMAIERVLNGIEHIHRFTRAVSIGNPRESLQAEKQEQEMAEACKRLIKNCIICWNYLYLSQKLAEMDDPARREAILNALTHGSAASWQHVSLLGEYDFSEERLRDTVGMKPPKLLD